MLQDRLSRAHPAVFSIFARFAGFFAYFSMYAFRKPFSAATFVDISSWHFEIDYKAKARGALSARNEQ